MLWRVRIGHWPQLPSVGGLALRAVSRASRSCIRSATTALRRAHEADVGAARIVRSHQHCLFAAVADAKRR
jgi:hypothetical protein